MKLVYSQIDRKILEELAGGPARQNKLVHEFSTTGTAPEYVHHRLRGLSAQGLILRERKEDTPGLWITITDSGRGALNLMKAMGAV